MATSPSINPEEIAKFEAMAEEWWSETGKFRPLHKINPLRIGFIKSAVGSRWTVAEEPPTTDHRPLTNITILDIGCGGGLLCEPLARLGAKVTGIDASAKNIGIATAHARAGGMELDYRNTSAEALAAEGGQFDVVLAMEVVEHVADVSGFLRACCALVKPGGMFVLSTLNRTAKAYALAVFGAEVILRWLPRGTHDWKKFLKPSEIEAELRANGLALKELRGMEYRMLRDEWMLTDDVAVNYLLLAEKK